MGCLGYQSFLAHFKMADTGALTVIVSFTLGAFLCLSGVVCGIDLPNTHVQHLSYPDFQTFIEDSHVRIVYFKRRVEPLNVKSFLREYEKAAQVLASYGIQLGLVECSSAPEGISHCPNDDTAERFIYGFRQSVEKIALSLETIDDTDSIVSSALHLALIHNVPIIHQLSERKNLEDHCKLKCNIIYTFQRVLGTYEHRVFMEAAHHFFDRYIFAMTTRESATRGLTTIDSEGEPSAILEEPAVWVLMCQHVADVTKDCLHTNYRNAMDLQNFSTFLEHLDLPDWVEFSSCGNITSDVYELNNLHSIFLVYDSEVQDKVMELAPELGLRFKGIAGVVVMDIKNFSPDHLLAIGFQPENLKPPAIGFKAHGQAKITVVNEYDNAYHFIVDQLKYMYGAQDLQQNSFELVEELDELQQDDELALSLQAVGAVGHLEDSVLTPLTDKTFSEFTKSRPLIAVLFYLHWDPLSNVALNVFSQTAEILDSQNSSAFGRVDCFDWTDVCDQENITTYPTVKVLRKGTRIDIQQLVYDTIALMATFVLCGTENPVLISSEEELKAFTSGELQLPGDKSIVVPSVLLGIQNLDKVDYIFESVAKEFHGLVRMGLCHEDVCHHIAQKFDVDFPFVLTFKPHDPFESFVPMTESINADSLKLFIQQSCLEVFPQLQEHNFATYRKGDVPLALVFMQSGDHQDAYTSLGKIAAASKHIRFAWMDLRNNVTRSIKTSLAPDTSEDEVTLVVVDYKKAFVYLYSGDILEEESVQRWLHFVSNETIKPSTMLPSGDWKPRLPGFDYLKFIDDDQVREGEDRYITDATLDDLDKLHQSRLFRLPGSSDKRLRMKQRDEEEIKHLHTELK